jgi:hypothetical protein
MYDKFNFIAFKEEKKMNKKSLLNLFVIITVCIILTGCFGAKPSENNEDTLVEGNVEKKVDTVLERLDKKDLKKLDSKKAAEAYDIEDTTGLDIGVYIKATEDTYEEVAIIKMSDNSKAEEIQQKVMGRLVKLYDEFKDNEKILSIIQNNENIEIKQEGGVQTVIISKDAKELAEKIKIQF